MWLYQIVYSSPPILAGFKSIFFFSFCNWWGRGSFDEGHQEQVSLDGAFGEHVIITTGGGGGTSPPIYWENWRKRKLCTISSRSDLHLTFFCRGEIDWPSWEIHFKQQGWKLSLLINIEWDGEIFPWCVLFINLRGSEGFLSPSDFSP